jgi:polyisoprenoid-binding protein YceI
MKTSIFAIIFLLPLATTPALLAQHDTFNVNPDASQVGFSLAEGSHHVLGTFHVQGGSISYDRDKKMSGSLVVAAGSGNSGNSSRDKRMNSLILESDHFAEVAFAPSTYQGELASTGDSTIQVAGVFTLHGAAHDLTVPMQVHIEGTSLTAKGHFTIPYVQWGLKDPSWGFFKVAKEVDIDLTLGGQLVHVN